MGKKKPERLRYRKLNVMERLALRMMQRAGFVGNTNGSPYNSIESGTYAGNGDAYDTEVFGLGLGLKPDANYPIAFMDSSAFRPPENPVEYRAKLDELRKFLDELPRPKSE